jgi:hypothetical protein
MFMCSFCKKQYSTKTNLNRHIESCNKPIKKFKCSFCEKELCSKQMLKYHDNICKEKKKINLELDNEDKIKKLEEKLYKMTTEIKILNNTTNNTTNNIVINETNNNNYGSILKYMTPENVQESFKNFSIKDLLTSESQRNLADMTINNFLSGKDHPVYLCKDRSRNKFFYTDKENIEKEDPNATVLRTLVYNGVGPIIKKIYGEQYVKLHNELARCLRNNNTETILCSRDDIKDLEDAYKQINILKDGDDYISQLSRCLPSTLKDRIYKDNLALEKKNQESDIELQLYLKKQTRMIGNYTIAELEKWKEFYIETDVIKGPKEIIMDVKYKKEYIDFLNEKD